MEMTDAEINLAIAKLEYPETRNLKLWVEQNMVSFTNGWMDIGPIIEREKLSLMPCKDDRYQASKWVGDTLKTAYADTPTKAAALLFLKIRGVK